jgi:sulfite exporter TauE/SafE
MSTEINALILTAFSIGFFHTLFGPDHYLPFVMISWAKKWSAFKTACITFLCGLGHILSSVVLGLVGVALGIMVGKLEIIESFRGNIAAWLLIAFGLVYFVWGLRQSYSFRRKRPYTRTFASRPALSYSS